jgi:hypothetical protein
MSPHWRIAARSAAWVSAGALVAGTAIWYLYGSSHAGAFLYGVAMGLLSFVSMAATVSMLTDRSTPAMMIAVAGSFGARCVFAAGALGIPAYLSLWPVFPMLGGFAMVYLAENVVLLPMMPRKVSRSGTKSGDESTEPEREERKVGT